MFSRLWYQVISNDIKITFAKWGCFPFVWRVHKVHYRKCSGWDWIIFGQDSWFSKSPNPNLSTWGGRKGIHGFRWAPTGPFSDQGAGSLGDVSCYTFSSTFLFIGFSLGRIHTQLFRQIVHLRSQYQRRDHWQQKSLNTHSLTQVIPNSSPRPFAGIDRSNE